MKKVEATIELSALDEVREALVGLGINEMSACEVRAYDPHARSTFYRGSEYTESFAPQVRIEVVIDDYRLAPCVAAISRCAGRGAAVPGAIVVLPVDDTSQTRTRQHPARAA